MNFENSWTLIPLWVMLFLLDDWLTILVAKRYDSQDPRIIEFEGGYELTPQYKEEIAEHRLFGPKFLRSLVIFALFFLMIKVLTSLHWLPQQVFTFVLGAAILLSCTVNIRHSQNLVFFGLIGVPEPPRGEIIYPASFSYRASAVGFFVFGLTYLLLSIILGSWFTFGGSIASFGTGLSHWRLAARTIPNSESAE